MKIPLAPPPFNKLLERIEPKRFFELFPHMPTERNYYHWDQLRHRTPPEGVTLEEWWFMIKWARMQSSRNLPLEDVEEHPFVYTLSDKLLDYLHQMDSQARGTIAVDEVITTPGSRDRYVINSLIEEAVTSSQLEGASTTRKVAVELLRSGRKPRDKSERMIVNNYLAMKAIGKLVGQELEPKLVLELHEMVCRDTLDDPQAVGRLQRQEDERVCVADHRDGKLLHTPPPAHMLSDRLEAMCAFANAKLDSGHFVHPVVRAIALHFWLAYDHPFEDGNGRTARALFYWAMLRAGYWLFEYVSISRFLTRAPAKYARAFLYTETDGNDMTYFLLHQLDVIHRAVAELYGYLKRKTREVRELESSLGSVEEFNHRQRALLAHALKHPEARYTIASHQRSHNVVYATARSDLLDLALKGLLLQRKIGRSWSFFVSEDLAHL